MDIKQQNLQKKSLILYTPLNIPLKLQGSRKEHNTSLILIRPISPYLSKWSKIISIYLANFFTLRKNATSLISPTILLITISAVDTDQDNFITVKLSLQHILRLEESNISRRSGAEERIKYFLISINIMLTHRLVTGLTKDRWLCGK